MKEILYTILMKIFLFLGFAFSLIFFSCSTNSPENDSQNELESIVCVFYGINGLGDLTYNDTINTGVTKAEADFNFYKISYSPKSWTVAEDYMNFIFAQIQNSFASKYKVFCIFADSHYIQLLEKNELFAKNLPMTTLLFNVQQSDIPESISDKVHSVFIPYYGGCYAAGKISKEISKTLQQPYEPFIILADENNRTLFECTQFFLKGFGLTPPASVTEADKSKSDYNYLFLSRVLGDSDSVSGYDMGDLLYKILGIQNLENTGKNFIILPICGGSTLGILHYADDKLELPYDIIGFDIDMYNYAPDSVVFSVIVDADKVVYECIEQWKKGKLPKSQIKTLEEGYTYILAYADDKKFPFDDKYFNAIIEEAVQVENERLLETGENGKS